MIKEVKEERKKKERRKKEGEGVERLHVDITMN